MNTEQLSSLQPALSAWVASFRPCFKRAVTFDYFQSYLLGLMADLRRKSVEPIALACGVAVRTMQEFLSMFAWDHARLEKMLMHRVADRCPRGGIGVIDATGHPKQGDKTPGVQRQYCGESGKIENCVVAQHLLFTDNQATNPFSCVLASDLYLPRVWADDRERCDEAGIGPELTCRPKWQIALEQVKQARAGGVKLNWVVFDEEYGMVPAFWFALDEMGQAAVGEAPSNFHAWVRRPACRGTGYPCHAARRVDNLATHSPAFTSQSWKRCKVKDTTRGMLVWEYKAARVHLSDSSNPDHNVSVPTDRMYWLIVMRQPRTGEIKYVISNAGEGASVEELIRVLLSRWHVEKWFERAKQDAGLGAFEVRTYVSLIRHWLCVRLAMCFLSEQTTRLRGEKCPDHLRAGVPSRLNPGGEDLAAGLEVMVAVDAAMCLPPAT
ncbi:MAG: IS701 family transposase [Phycisphaeraceae bacterium]|nr:IS701 family transposase [Phycisphaeraceae bacterium]